MLLQSHHLPSPQTITRAKFRPLSFCPLLSTYTHLSSGRLSLSKQSRVLPPKPCHLRQQFRMTFDPKLFGVELYITPLPPLPSWGSMQKSRNLRSRRSNCITYSTRREVRPTSVRPGNHGTSKAPPSVNFLACVAAIAHYSSLVTYWQDVLTLLKAPQLLKPLTS